MKDIACKFPGELPECDNCNMSLQQCYQLTSAIPCRCKIWENYNKDVDRITTHNYEKQ